MPPRTHPLGAENAYATTWGTKKSIAQRESYATTADVGGIYTSFTPTSATTTATNGCMAKNIKYQTQCFMETARVEVEPTSILKGG